MRIKWNIVTKTLKPVADTVNKKLCKGQWLSLRIIPMRLIYLNTLLEPMNLEIVF